MKSKNGFDQRIKAVIYTRVSTEDQAKKGFSLGAQLEKLRSYCHARDWKIFKEYTDDGYSGRNIRRPAYQQLLNQIDQWDILLVVKMDRIHRNSKNFMQMMELLKQKNKEFVSMTESLDTSTAIGRFVMDIIQRIAQLESEQIGERVYIGMEQKARTNGGVLGFNIPLGYRYEHGKLILIKDEAEIVQTIFLWYLQGKSMTHISRILNFARIHTKMGGIWTAQTITRILQNPLYCGFLKWESYIYKNDHQKIIKKSDFNKIQRIINRRNNKTKNATILKI